MGSAITFHLVRRGARVLALDQFALAHDRGSSHGVTRIMRHAYYNAPTYVPLVKRAQSLWHELEEITGKVLFVPTGGISLGTRGARIVRGALLSAHRFGLEHEVLDASEIQKRFPALRLSPDMVGVRDPSAGLLLAEDAIRAHVAAAQAQGAEVRFNQTVTDWRAKPTGVEVHTNRSVHLGDRLVVAAGAWMPKLVTSVPLPLAVTRQVVGWFETNDPPLYEPSRLPIWLLQPPGDHDYYYGLPRFGPPGLKVGRMHHRQPTVSPATMDRDAHNDDEAILRKCLVRYFPGANGQALALKTCMFTSTPDGHFIIDKHPAHANVLILSACSGHGFKFAPVVGEIAANLILDGQTHHDIQMFRIDRFDEMGSDPLG